jgi:hypothetical protein
VGNPVSQYCDPMSEPKARVLLRIPASLKAKLTALAEQEQRSLNKQIEFLLHQSVRERPSTDAELQRTKADRGNRKRD